MRRRICGQNPLLVEQLKDGKSWFPTPRLDGVGGDPVAIKAQTAIPFAGGKAGQTC